MQKEQKKVFSILPGAYFTDCFMTPDERCQGTFQRHSISITTDVTKITDSVIC